MATAAPSLSIPQPAAPTAFFRNLAITMAATVLIGFSLQWFLGRSTFAARPLVHAHAIVFMGWVAIFLTQALLADSNRIDIHRKLGKIAMFWVPLLVIFGLWLTADVVARGITPFFFLPQHFLIANPATVIAFAAMFAFAVRMRKRTDWHMRLQFGAMTCIMGPALGRILPVPFMIPYAFQITGLVCLIFPIAGAIRDRRRDGRVHAAWWIAIIVNLALVIVPDLIIASPPVDALYAWVTAGQPGEAVPGLKYPPFPPGL